MDYLLSLLKILISGTGRGIRSIINSSKTNIFEDGERQEGVFSFESINFGT